MIATDAGGSVLDTVLEVIGEALLITDPTGVVTRVNHAFCAKTGLTPETVVGLPLAGLNASPNSAVGPGDRLVLTLGQAGQCALTPTAIKSKDKLLGYAVTLRPMMKGDEENGRDGTGGNHGFDRLTGLPNRHLFRDRVEQTLHHARRAQKTVAVVLVGIDRFSRINQAMGEKAGDHLLQELTRRLRHCVRTSDTVARMDGDRFAFIMQITAASDSVTVAEKVLSAFALPFNFASGEEAAITCSLGVSIFPEDGEDAEGLIKNAVTALSHAKSRGRNRYQFFAAEMNYRARHRLDLESGIRRALANNEFILHYQPKVEVESGRVAGLEALIRWQDPQKGMISPGLFIPVAEESSLIEQIGQWVLEETCRQNRRWQEEGLSPLKASVNVSARQFRNRDFVAAVAEVLRQSGLDPRWLELEITESMLMGDMDAVVKRMEDLRSLGVSLSIDDFGTGYSSLSYLGRFPITTLKIDRAFIVDVQSNPHTAEIARAIIGLSRGLNLEVVAEGAEVKEQIEFLQTNGCSLVQGFFYSKPLAAADFTALLRTSCQNRVMR